MRDYMAAQSYQAAQPGTMRSQLQIHVGIGTGPVVAGVIGMKKFIYDLWGDTVNIASRVTAEAGAGTILVDATTWRRVREDFEFEGARIINVKGKGEVTVYHLLGRKAPAARQAS